MKKMIVRTVLPCAAGLALLAGCVVESPEAAGPEAPPPPEAQVMPPQPDVTYVWTPGYWDWNGRWVWTRGYWGPPSRPGAVWVQGHWARHGHRNYWVHSHWQ